MLRMMPEAAAVEVALARIPEDFQEHFRRQLSEHRWCGGLAGEACAFALRPEGGQARVAGARTSCLLCDPAKLALKCLHGPLL